MDIDPAKDLSGEFITGFKKGKAYKKYPGYKYPEDVCQWFSTAIDEDVVVLRSANDHREKMDPKEILYFDKSDGRKAFNGCSALHIINKASVGDLKKRLDKRYPDGLENDFVTVENFRPNVVLDADTPYCEDYFLECRIGAALIRSVGPCTRCDRIRVNLDKHEKVAEFEPYSELSKYRTLKGKGVMFGMFYQMDILSNKHLWTEVLPEKLGYTTFAESSQANPIHKRQADGDFYVRCFKKDGILVRRQESEDWIESIKKDAIKNG